jgi:hypothetical protein
MCLLDRAVFVPLLLYKMYDVCYPAECIFRIVALGRFSVEIKTSVHVQVLNVRVHLLPQLSVTKFYPRIRIPKDL